MLSIKSISAQDAGGIANYYEQLAKADDYYDKDAGGEEPAGYWLGGCASELGLHGEVKDGQLLAALTGHDPLTGAALAKNAGPEHKPGWDCTFSSPKSVSAAWAIADPEMREKIETAHRQAVSVSVNYIEEHAASTRHGKGGEVHVPASENGGILVAVYQHSTSRNQDPQLHSHCLISNLNKDGRGLDLDTRHKMAAGALYRVELAHQLKEIGFQIERDGKSFAIAGVPQKLVEEWSSRRAQIEEKLAEKGLSGAKASAVAALETRTAKEAVSHAVLREKWTEQAKAHQFTADKIRELADPSKRLEKEPEQLKKGSEIVNDLTERNATFTRLQALHQVALDAQGKTSAADALERIGEVLLPETGALSLGEISRSEAEAHNLKSGDRYTTAEVLKAEEKMLDAAQRLAEKPGFAVAAEKVEQFAASKGLSEQQTRALEHVTADNSAAALQGWAGAGKSYLMDAARQSWEASGYEVRGAALSNSAAENLQSEAGIPSTSIAKLAFDLDSGNVQLTSKTVLVIDEAGLVGTKQMQNLFEKAEEAGAKIVLVGDTKQLQSIDAGAAFRAVGEKIGQVELSEVRRQNTQAEREIAQDFREGRASEALDKLDKLDRLTVSRDMGEARAEAVKAFMSDRQDGKSTLLIAGTRDEVRLLNAEVRTQLQGLGHVEKEGITAKTSSGYREFSVGDEVRFGEKFAFGQKGDDSRTVVNNTRGVVVSVREVEGKPEVQVKLERSGQVVNVQLEKFDKLDHSYASTNYKAQGRTVDRTHVVAGEQTGREWSYVAGSRHREEVRIYTSKDHHQRAQPENGKDQSKQAEKAHTREKSDLEKGMGKSDQKDMASDYARAGKSEEASSPSYER